jgi:hypothetical protein
MLCAILALCIAVVGFYWGSVFYSARSLEAAFRDRDTVQLERYIDWLRLREQLRSEIRSAATIDMIKNASQDSATGFGVALAGVIGPAIIDRMIDNLLTPQALVRLLHERKDSAQISISHLGFTNIDEYTLVIHQSSPTKRPDAQVILQRNGLIWQVVRLRFKPGEAPWETQSAASGLEITLTPTRAADTLIVEGDIVNETDATRNIPKIRLTLRDAKKTDLVSQIIIPPIDQLAPRGRTRFKAVFEHPPIVATGVAATFVSAWD